MKEKLHNPMIMTIAVICFCFLLTSVSWLAWEYHLMEQMPSHTADLMTMVVGYLLQAVGICVFGLLLRGRSSFAIKAVPAVLLLHALCLIPAVLSRHLTGTLLSGFLLNVFCGYIAGYYLFVLMRIVEAKHRASTLGLGYALSILAAWGISAWSGFYYSDRVWILCLILTVLTLPLIRVCASLSAQEPTASSGTEGTEYPRAVYTGMVAAVLLFSMIQNLGFAFSSADVVAGIRPEMSRLFYAAGLLAAGLLSDRERKTGAILALTSLIIPFIMLALRGEPLSLSAFWALSYFAFGFLTIFRILLFSDLAERSGRWFLAGAGLMIGRVGDAAGEAICLALGAHQTALVFLSALLFFAGVLCFFQIYRLLYVPEPQAVQDEHSRFYTFALQQDLTARESEILQMLLERKTNSEIAEAFSISENTVKFHVRNVLKKTGCRNRNDLLGRYFGA